MRSPKKIIGSLGRRYGGRPFQTMRKLYYDFLSYSRQCREVRYLKKGRYAPEHPDARFLARYYSTVKPVDHDEVEGIVCMCDGRMYHGGPTDRLRGILTTYEEAKRRGLPFHIHWTSPFPLERYLEPASFDWRIPEEGITYSPDRAFPVIIEDETNRQSRMRMDAGLALKFHQLHVYSNADNSIGRYRDLYQELFRPTELLRKEVEKNLKSLGPDYWAFTFRFLHLLGDFKEWSQDELDDDEKEAFIGRVIEELLRKLEDLPEGYRALVTSDSTTFLRRVRDIDSRIYVVPGDVKNIDLLKGEYPDAWLKTFVDQQLLMGAERVYLMRTGKMYKSGFPRFAAEVGGAEFIDWKF